MVEFQATTGTWDIILQAGVPSLWDLMPDDLRWRRCNNNRKKVHNKYNALESFWNHPTTPSPMPVCGNIALPEIGPWCQKGWGPPSQPPCLTSNHPNLRTFSNTAFLLIPLLHIVSSVLTLTSSICLQFAWNAFLASLLPNWLGESLTVVFDSLWPQGLYRPWNSPGQNTGVCSLSLLQGIFPTQGSNPGLPHCRQILYQLNH